MRVLVDGGARVLGRVSGIFISLFSYLVLGMDRVIEGFVFWRC